MTGDQFARQSDGYFYYRGRTDDMLKVSGIFVSPLEIEDCLLGHPAVRMAGVVGKPDPQRTEIVKAYIVLKDGRTPSAELAGEIQSHVKTRLAAHEYPREIAFVDALPMTTTGKIIRRELRARAAAEAEQP